MVTKSGSCLPQVALARSSNYLQAFLLHTVQQASDVPYMLVHAAVHQ